MQRNPLLAFMARRPARRWAFIGPDAVPHFTPAQVQRMVNHGEVYRVRQTEYRAFIR